MPLKVATIVPQAHLDVIADDNYLMCISHVVQDKRNRNYTAFFRGKSVMGDYVILDNSVIELKAPESIESIIKSAELVAADEIVLPDQSFDMERTLQLTRHAIAELKARGLPYKRMAAPHGTTALRWISCARTLIEEGDIDTLGLSYLYTEMFKGRINMVKVIYPYAVQTGVNIHLLGCMIDPIEVYEISQHYPNVRGVDSAISCVYAQNGIRMGAGMPPRPPRNLDFATDQYDELLLRWNVLWWKERCLSGENFPDTRRTLLSRVQ